MPIITLAQPAYSRCAVCYTNGLSGASITLIIILISISPIKNITYIDHICLDDVDENYYDLRLLSIF